MLKSFRNNNISEGAVQALHLEGVLYALSGISLLVYAWFYDSIFSMSSLWITIPVFISFATLFFSAVFCSVKPLPVKFSAIAGIFIFFGACVPKLIKSPIAAMITLFFLSFLIYFIVENIPRVKNILKDVPKHDRISYRTQSAAIAIIPFIVVTFSFYRGGFSAVPLIAAFLGLTVGAAGLLYLFTDFHKVRAWLNLFFFTIVSLFVIYGAFFYPQLLWISILWPVNTLFFSTQNSTVKPENTYSWFIPLLNHPARLLVSTFFGLIAIGTLLLMLPISSSTETGISPVNAAFTSTSAVCITGLIVQDTPVDFSVTGQLIILILIQLGGLGIMSIATIALHVLGKRFSLRQGRVLAAVSGDDRSSLVESLRRVLIFTLLMESAGAIILSILFYIRENSISSAVWRGIFTSVSAFCNAGFALQSDSLIPYQQNPLILHTVAILIILGGLSPAVCLYIPDLLKGRKVPLAVFLVFTTTAVLLVSGTFIIGLMEWDSTLKDFSFVDRIHNAWFQSVTLRTAGFNSIDISSICAPTYSLMLFMMFIGGSPGGTAGGVKTTTLAVFFLCMSSVTRGRQEVILKNRKIGSEIIYKAIAVTGAGLVILFISVFILELTQFIPVRDIIFEVFSALGTVGLSTGATPYLDDIGKITIMVTMFLGRVGPLTMFMVLSSPVLFARSKYPSAEIPIT